MMATKASERVSAWRAERLAAGYRQKVFLLSPEALAALERLAEKHGTDRDAAEAALIAAARRLK
jgi:hypothetical protein